MANARKTYSKKVERLVIIISFLLVPLAFLAVFSYWPALKMAQLSFFSWDGMSPDMVFIGFKNFIDLFNDHETLATFGNNFAYLVIMVLQTFLALYLAIVLNSKIRGSKAARTIIFMPYVLNGVAIAFMFSFLYAHDGPLNQFLRAISGGNLSVDWLGADYTINFNLAYIGTWRWTGFNMVIFLAGLQSIPTSILEAARVDGASFFQTIRFIIFPNIHRVFELVLFMGLSGVVNAYFEPYVMTKGGPGGMSETFVTKQLAIAFEYHKFGKAAAMGLIIILIVIVLRRIQTKVFGEANGK